MILTSLDMKTPADVYQPSARVYRGLAELDYPFHDWSEVVTHCGRICFKGRKINLSHVFAGQQVDIKQIDDRIWLVSFMHYDLGYFDDESCRLESIAIPSADRVTHALGMNVTHAPGIKRHLCDPKGPLLAWLLGLDSNQQPSG